MNSNYKYEINILPRQSGKTLMLCIRALKVNNPVIIISCNLTYKKIIDNLIYNDTNLVNTKKDLISITLDTFITDHSNLLQPNSIIFIDEYYYFPLAEKQLLYVLLEEINNRVIIYSSLPNPIDKKLFRALKNVKCRIRNNDDIFINPSDLLDPITNPNAIILTAERNTFLNDIDTTNITTNYINQIFKE